MLNQLVLFTMRDLVCELEEVVLNVVQLPNGLSLIREILQTMLIHCACIDITYDSVYLVFLRIHAINILFDPSRPPRLLHLYLEC